MGEYKKRVFAPYNFVPFASRVLPSMFAGEKELPPHDQFCPELLTGEIHMTAIADTPVFVSNGVQRESIDSPAQVHFFQNPDGVFQIPASSLRGLVRENMEILSCGEVRVDREVANQSFYFREMASAQGSLRYPLKEIYTKTLGIKQIRTQSGASATVPTNVRSGYLACEGKDKYVIYPLSEPVIRVRRNNPSLTRDLDWDASVTPVSYRFDKDHGVRLQRGHTQAPGLMRGYLLCTGRAVGRIRNVRYLFPELKDKTQKIPISSEDIAEYKADYEFRETTLGRNKTFWKLPAKQTDGMKPVFFLEVDGHIVFGMSRYLRIRYEHKVGDGIRQTDVPALDFPNAIMGFADQNSAYRSRVSFGNLSAGPDVREMPLQKALQQSPKASFFGAYTLGGKHYSSKSFTMRGYKQYWLKKPEALTVSERQEKNAKWFRFLPKGTKFSGVIRFKNLKEEELGLLLWCIRLQKNCYQSVGAAKAYGYGRMKFRIDRVLSYCPQELYLGLNYQPIDMTGQVDDLIDCYDRYAGAQLSLRRISDLDSIQDFFYLRSKLQDGPDFRYMDINQREYSNVQVPLPTTAQIRAKDP